MSNSHRHDHPESLVDRAAASVSAFADNVRTDAEDFANQATAAGEHAYGQARRQVRDVGTTVVRSVEQQPVIALAVLGFVCLAAGFLLGRR